MDCWISVWMDGYLYITMHVWIDYYFLFTDNGDVSRNIYYLFYDIASLYFCSE